MKSCEGLRWPRRLPFATATSFAQTPAPATKPARDAAATAARRARIPSRSA